jgi:hypothetical protein
MYPSGAWIVSYHGVAERIQDPWLQTDFISLKTVVEHLNYFVKHRVVVSLDELLSSIAVGKAVDPRFVVICFDDALACLLPHVVEELATRRMPYVIGVPAGIPGTGRSLWEYEAAFLVHLSNLKGALSDLARAMLEMTQTSESVEGNLQTQGREIADNTDAPHVLALLKSFLRHGISSSARLRVLSELISELEPSFEELLKIDGRFSVMSWEQLCSLQSLGGTLVAHGFLHHPHNATLEDSCRRNELKGALESIKHHTGVTTECFIWPEGISDRKSIEVGKSVGYKYFLSTRPGRLHQNTCPTDVPRVSGQWPIAQVLWNAASLR